MAEFNEHGYAGTDSNRIARRAGFAPQTFYRWYKDKAAIFIACYRAWEDEERSVLQALTQAGASAEAFVQAGIDQHCRYLMFRRSLRMLSLENEEVRKARAESRLRQIVQIRAWGASAESDEAVAVVLLQIERLTDAVAEGELADMGLGEAAARRELAALVSRLRAGG
ncbi:MAG TPA: TetR/AcrR family transcriptional regulator [Phenylobacterium sp.]